MGQREGNREIKLFSGVMIMNSAGSVAYIGFKSRSHGSRYRTGESSGSVGPWQREAGGPAEHRGWYLELGSSEVLEV